MNWINSICHYINSKKQYAIDVAQIAGFFTAVFVLMVAITTMEDTQNQINVLKNISNSTQKQLFELENTVKEIQQQTLVSAYINGGIHNVVLEKCSINQKQLQKGADFETFLYLKPILVGENRAQTVVPARIFGDLEFSGKK